MYKKGDRVRISVFEATVLNEVYEYGEDGEKDRLVGLRITDRRRPVFWSVIPIYLVDKIEVSSGQRPTI